MASVDDLWLVDFGGPFPGEPAFERPALVIGPPDAFGPGFPFVIVVPLTSSDRGLSLHVEVEPTSENGLGGFSYVQCELIRSVSRQRLLHRLGEVERRVSGEVATVVKTLLSC